MISEGVFRDEAAGKPISAKQKPTKGERFPVEISQRSMGESAGEPNSTRIANWQMEGLRNL